MTITTAKLESKRITYTDEINYLNPYNAKNFPLASTVPKAFATPFNGKSRFSIAQEVLPRYIKITTSSVKTPGFYTKKQFSIKWIPKKHPLVPPRKPVFRPPTPRPYKPFVFRATTTWDQYLSFHLKKLKRFGNLPSNVARYSAGLQRAWNKRTQILLQKRMWIIHSHKQQYEHYLARIAVKRSMYTQRYNILLRRYETRQAKYEKLLRLKNEGLTVFRKVRSKAALPRNPYSRILESDFGFSFNYYRRQHSTTQNTENRGNGPYLIRRTHSYYPNMSYKTWFGTLPAFTSRLPLDVDARASRSLFNEIASQRIHIGNIIAERAQTFDLICNLIKGILSPRSVIASLLKSPSRKISDDFLQFQFGVLPLINDLYTLANTYDKKVSSESIIIRKGASATANYAWNEFVPTYYPPYTKNHNVIETRKVFYSLEYKVKNSGAVLLQQYGLINPAEIAWEAMPWSFVIDWVLPIGAYIRSLSADVGLEYVGGTRTVVNRAYYQSSIDGPLWTDTGDASLTWEINGSGAYIYETKVRTVLPTAPVPMLPSVKNPLSYLHIAEALALTVQRTRR